MSLETGGDSKQTGHFPSPAVERYADLGNLK